VYRKLKKQSIKEYESHKNETYGEITPEGFSIIIEELRITNRDVFIDIGSGRVANLVIQVDMLCNCSSIGIEIRENLHELAIKSLEKYKNLVPTGGRAIELYNMNCLDKNAERLYSRATILFMNNDLWDETQIEGILKMFMKTLQPNTRLVCTKDIFGGRIRDASSIRYKDHPLKMFNYPGSFSCSKENGLLSWTDSPLQYWTYTVKSTKV